MVYESDSPGENGQKTISSVPEHASGKFGDLRYFDALVKDESNSLHGRILAAIEASPNPYEHLKAITNVLVEHQAMLSARITLLERALSTESWIEETDRILQHPIAEYNFAPQPEVEVLAKDFKGYGNVYELEHTSDGLPYVWFGPAPELVLDVPVLRDEPKVFRLGFISTLLTEDLLKTIEIIVDGKKCQVDFDFDGSTRGIWCLLPTQEKSKASRIEVKLPQTVSPADLGKSDDKRKLGLAISGYKVSMSRCQTAESS